jgi:hypothetical protein
MDGRFQKEKSCRAEERIYNGAETTKISAFLGLYRISNQGKSNPFPPYLLCPEWKVQCKYAKERCHVMLLTEAPWKYEHSFDIFSD